MKKSEKILLVAVIGLLAAAVICRFALQGARFGAQMCVAAAMALSMFGLLCRWAKKSIWGARCKAFLLAMLCGGGLTFGVLEGVILTHAAGELDASADVVIVLGAGVNGTVPSLVLQTRIDAAADYLRQHPDIPAILSGGQGPGEAITEAVAMFRALTAQGIAPERLRLEERSTSTMENFAFSKLLLTELGLDAETAMVAVVSNDFHLYRAERIAQTMGMHALGVPAPLPWAWLGINYYIREAFAVANTLLFQL